MTRLTIAIPTHDMENKANFLIRCLDSLWNQTFQDFDIVVADNSEDDVLQDICTWYGGIDYFKNPRKGMAQNTNAAIKRSRGTLIKILYMDDFLAHNKALELIWDNFDGNWLVTGCEHTDGAKVFSPHKPRYIGIEEGLNTIGSPSVLTIKNETPLMFDENMTWLLDVDYYKRLHALYGTPIILDDIGVVMGLGIHQMTHRLTTIEKLSEETYLKQKYA